jgi:V8-like Glu-specific endopeptidase
VTPDQTNSSTIIAHHNLATANGVGTGFFVNIPTAEHDVIFTAGHNLLGSHDMKVLIAEDGKDFISVPDKDFQIADAYRANDNDKVNDYGVIFLPRKNRKGFGFSLQLAYLNFGKRIKVSDRVKGWKYAEAQKSVYITGYRPANPPGSPSQHDGTLFLDRNQQQMESQLEYKLDTEEGMSGSAIWMAYKGREIAIGIQ